MTSMSILSSITAWLAAAVFLFSPAPKPAEAPEAIAATDPAVAAKPAAALDLAAYKGQVVLLDFWASWCIPCGESFPWMAVMKHRYGARGLTILTVNLDVDRTAADAFLGRHPLEARHVYDPEGKLAEAYGLEMMPTSILLDREGNPAFRHEGFREEDTDEYERHIVALLDGKSAGADGPDAGAVEAKGSSIGARPWERHLLSRREMLLNSDPLEILFDEHIYFSKEASSGGRGFGGGGCGCN